MTEPIGFVGAGQMGMPMVERLVGAGHRVSVFARNPTARAQAEAVGAVTADSVADVAKACSLVITCLFSDDQLVDVVDNMAGHLTAGAVVVSHTTGRVPTVQTLAKLLFDKGCALVDAPISGTADNIREGKLTVLLGGDGGVVDAIRPVLSAYASTLLFAGPVGAALTVKLVNNALFAANVQLALEGERLAGDLGLDVALFRAALGRSSGRSYASDAVARHQDSARFATAVTPFLVKDVAAVAALCADTAVELGSIGHAISSGPLGDLGHM